MCADVRGTPYSHALYCILQYQRGVHLDLYYSLQYVRHMTKERVLQIRLTDAEKQGFQDAADLAGIPLSAWVRERLRLAAIRDLESVGPKRPFVTPIHLGDSYGRTQEPGRS